MEPHQRTQSGKLRKTNKFINSIQNNNLEYSKKIVYIGLQNAQIVERYDTDDEYDTYLQTPTVLCTYQVTILKKIANSLGISSPNCVDKNWRNTWNIGGWHIGNKISICANFKQPNISNCWINISNIGKEKIEEITNMYSSQNLAKSSCKVVKGGSVVQIQGRWTINIANYLLEENISSSKNIEIVSTNISQSRLYFWMTTSTGSNYICLLTKKSIDILIKYVPEWCMDIHETSSGGSIALKFKNPSIPNDSAQISISESGWIQYQGRIENIEHLYNAIRIAIFDTVNSKFLKLFLQNLEYKIM